MATLINGAKIEEVIHEYGVMFADGHTEELDSREEAEETAEFLDGAQLMTRAVYVSEWQPDVYASDD